LFLKCVILYDCHKLINFRCVTWFGVFCTFANTKIVISYFIMYVVYVSRKLSNILRLRPFSIFEKKTF
jgi:hypothetical protein